MKSRILGARLSALFLFSGSIGCKDGANNNPDSSTDGSSMIGHDSGPDTDAEQLDSGSTGGSDASTDTGELGRIFFDDFESYAAGPLPTTSWSQLDAHPLCQVVTVSVDGMLGPYQGSKMLRCDATSSNQGETAWLNTSNYTNELFVRVRMRIDAAHQRTSVSPRKILRYFVWHSPYMIFRDVFEVIGDFESQPGTSNQAAWTEVGTSGNINLTTYWGDNASDHTMAATSWHTIEYYFNHSNSNLKVWHDDVLVRDSTKNGDGLGFGATKWSEFYLTSNWEDAHGAGNYVYFDHVEIFSDNGS